MRILRLFRSLAAAFLLSPAPLVAETVTWFSDPGGLNRDGAGGLMDSGFQFQLGVFSGGFQPTPSNITQWPAFWTSSDSASYDVGNKRYAGQIEVVSNSAPFTVGAEAWVLGKKVTETGTEMILFRRNTWLWPAPNPLNPIADEWRLNGAPGVQVVVGTVHPSGSPFLMQSLTVRSYDQWRTTELAGEPLGGINDDPDQDGVANLLEFIFGSNPMTPGPPPVTVISKVNVAGNDYLQISIPRRRDRLALLKVQVSSDLQTWHDGGAFTEVMADNPLEWVVRDKTPYPPAGGKRFMRLAATLPAP